MLLTTPRRLSDMRQARRTVVRQSRRRRPAEAKEPPCCYRRIGSPRVRRSVRTDGEVRHAAIRGVDAALVRHVAGARVCVHVPRQHQVHLRPATLSSPPAGSFLAIAASFYCDTYHPAHSVVKQR